MLPGYATVALFSCNRSGYPAPSSFELGMNVNGGGNLFMVRCKSGTNCRFNELPATSKKERMPASGNLTATGAEPAPRELRGSWRSLQMQQD